MTESFADSFVEQFPTTVLWRRYSDIAPLNAALAALVLQLRESAPNAAPGSSTRGGYQTDTNFLYRDEPAVKSLQQMINVCVHSYLGRHFRHELIAAPKGAEARMWGWAVIMRAGDCNVPHVHPDAHVSGVYYVQVPDLAAADDDPSPGGSLVFFDPRAGDAMHMTKGHRSIHSYVPTAGSLVVFPSYHMHGVFPFRGPGERISVAFNVRLNLT